MRQLSSIFLLIIAFTVAGVSGQAPYPQFTSIGAGVAGDPRAVVTADFDDDGDMDFATANIRSENPASVTIALWVGPGPSGEFKVTRIPLPEGPIALTAVDVNRDGSKDLAVVSADAALVSILLNDGSGTFAVDSQITTPTQPREIVHGDFNRDGWEDFAVAVLGCDCVQIAEQHSDGQFTTEVTEMVGVDPWGLATADLDGDGLLDLITTNSGAQSATVLYGHGNGSFGGTIDGVPGRVQTPTGRGPRAVAVGDFNRDGRLDFVTANNSSSDLSFSVVLAIGDRAFAAPLRHYVGTTPRDAEVIDINGDGKLDLLGADSTNNRFMVLIGRGDGCFGGPRTTTGCAAGWAGFSAGPGARSVATADFNRDGRVDAAVANQSGFVSIFFNQTAFTGR
jgi:hypothetical protein